MCTVLLGASTVRHEEDAAQRPWLDIIFSLGKPRPGMDAHKGHDEVRSSIALPVGDVSVASDLSFVFAGPK